MAPNKVWDDKNKIRLLLAIIDTGDTRMSAAKWNVVSQKMGGGVTGESARQKFAGLKQDATLQLLPVDEPSSLPSTPIPATPTPLPRKRAASAGCDLKKGKRAKMTANADCNAEAVESISHAEKDADDLAQDEHDGGRIG